MTAKQDQRRVDFCASMTAPALPDYSAEPKVIRRVGKIIGESASDEERTVRSSDSRGREEVTPNAPHGGGQNIWLWLVLMCASLCTAILLGVLAYRRYG